MRYLDPVALVVDFFVANSEFLKDRAAIYQTNTKNLTELADLYIQNVCFRKETDVLIPDYTCVNLIDEKPFAYLLEKFTTDADFYLQVYKTLELQGKRLLREHEREFGRLN